MIDVIFNLQILVCDLVSCIVHFKKNNKICLITQKNKNTECTSLPYEYGLNLRNTSIGVNVKKNIANVGERQVCLTGLLFSLVFAIKLHRKFAFAVKIGRTISVEKWRCHTLKPENDFIKNFWNIVY